jgi:hypothetical protein
MTVTVCLPDQQSWYPQYGHTMAGIVNHFCTLVPNLHLKLYLPIISGVKHHHCSSTDLMDFKENLGVTHSLNMSQNFGCVLL